MIAQGADTQALVAQHCTASTRSLIVSAGALLLHILVYGGRGVRGTGVASEPLVCIAALCVLLALWDQWCALAAARSAGHRPAYGQALAKAHADAVRRTIVSPTPRQTPRAAPAPPRFTRAAASPKDVPEGFASNCCAATLVAKPHTVSGYELNSHDMEVLGKGDALFGFLCKKGSSMTEEERGLFRPMINLSHFHDEVSDNQAPTIDMDNADQYTFFLTRSMYVVPGVKMEDVTVETLSDVAYHKACQPGKARVWEDIDSMPVHSFRITKNLVWFYAITIQLKVSEVDAAALPSLTPLMGGLRVHRALLLERTHRPSDVPNDPLRKVKSLLLFHALPSGRGFLWSNPTALVVGNVPGPLAAVINTAGKMGSAEVAETATLTRQHFARTGAAPK